MNRKNNRARRPAGTPLPPPISNGASSRVA